jgi:NAD(P)H-dependent flavin oxidoreductase YrpB (nitropropane dioxygenase family)
MSDKSGEFTPEEIEARVPPEHRRHVEQILASNGIDTAGLWDNKVSESFGNNMREEGIAASLEVAFAHPIKMIVNALGVPPQSMMDRAREHDVVVGALTGAREHAIKHADAGVDILIVAGTEAGGHCGEVSTLVLVPEVLESLKEYDRDIPILAAGGIVTGKQMAACMAMGAEGAWTGSVWLTTAEAETAPVIKEKFLSASSRQTVRSRSRTGKYTRQLRSPWTDAWQVEGAPDPLPMPLQGERSCRVYLPVRLRERTVCRELAERNFSLITGAVSASAVVSHTEPVQAPSAPIAIQAAICLPVTMPPAARMGISRSYSFNDSRTSGTSTRVDTSPQ